MGKFVTKLPPNISPSSPEELYEEAYIYAGYRMPIQWVINKFWSSEEAVNYYQCTINIPQGVIIIPKQDMEVVNKVMELLTANPFTMRYFVNNKEELLHQLPVYFEYMGVECKALLDGVLINHEEKYIEPFDLKTFIRGVYEFPDAYVRFGYFRQAAFYDYAIRSDFSPLKSLIDDGYQVKDFLFIVAEKKLTSRHPAVMFRTTPESRSNGFTGGYYNGKYYKGIDSLIKDYAWHVENKYWDVSRELFENKGVLTLDPFDSIPS